MNSVSLSFLKACANGDCEHIEKLLIQDKFKQHHKIGIIYLTTQGASIAAQYGNVGILKILLSNGIKYDYSATLARAACGGHVDCVEFLLNLDLNTENKHNIRTALYEACNKGYVDIVDLLLDYKDSSHIFDLYEALKIAITKWNLTIVDKLIIYGANYHKLTDDDISKITCAKILDRIKSVRGDSC